MRTGQERQVHQCVSIMWFIHTYALSSNICYYNNYDKCGKFKNASQRTARKAHIHTHIQQKPVRGVKRGMHVCVCAKGAANRAQKATELRNSGSRPNDNCFLALAAEQTHMYVCMYVHGHVCMHMYWIYICTYEHV